MVLVHGGGFRGGTKESYIPLAVKLAEHGYVAATANYRLSPRNQFPAAVEDVEGRGPVSSRQCGEVRHRCRRTSAHWAAARAATWC